MKVKNIIIEFLIISSVPFISGNPRRCADLLFIVTKPSTTKWAYNILTVAL